MMVCQYKKFMHTEILFVIDNTQVKLCFIPLQLEKKGWIWMGTRRELDCF